MKPLEELAKGPNSILYLEQVKTLFGPVADIANHHELFYSALLSRTLDWHIQQKIGDIFMSSVSNDGPYTQFFSWEWAPSTLSVLYGFCNESGCSTLPARG